jgi:uncharacterized membrane protein
MTGSGFWRRPLLWLALMTVAFVAFTTYAGVVAYDNFQTHNASDVGIVTQAMASTTFGHHAPFYESFDCAIKDRCSFLLVHPGLVLYAAVPFYALAPTSVTLFALQAVAVGAGALPLYWLTRQVSKSAPVALFAAGLYLVWAPLFAETAFSLHLECLLPVELLGVAALWQAGRYRWGLLLALASFLSFEIAPVFVFLIGAFFLVPYLREPGPGRSGQGAPDSGSTHGRTWTLEHWRAQWRAAMGRAEVRYSVALMACALGATLVIYSFMNVWGSSLLGVRPTVVAPGAAGFFYNSSTTPIQSFGFIVSSGQTGTTLEYWLILFAFAGFLPWLAPRSFVLTGPWIAYSFLTDNSKFSSIGLHTTLVVIGPLFIGVAYGLGRLTSWWTATPSVPDSPGTAFSSRRDRALRGRGRPAPRGLKAGIGAALMAVVVANVLFSPVNPILPDLGYHPGAPFIADYFDNSLTIQPGLAWTEELVAHIPENATIAATTSVFPVLANRPFAVVMEGNIWPWGDAASLARLPFNVTDGPQYVLTPASGLSSLPGYVKVNLSDPARYGLSGYVTSTAQGPLVLYEAGFSGAAAAFGPPLAPARAEWWPSQGLRAGPGGTVQTDTSAEYGEVIQSRSGANSSASVWTGPGGFLAPGAYSIRIVVWAGGLGPNPETPVLKIVGAGFDTSSWNATFDRSDFTLGSWTNLTENLTLTNPVPAFELEGFVLQSTASIEIASEMIEPASLG